MDKGNSLSLPTGGNARKHLDSKKKSDSRNVHPGYSMFEWNVLCDSGQDLSGVGGNLKTVTLEELEKHSTEKDAWTAVRGKVYNITHFMKFHPGGKAQLMRGAGNDCTELYDKIHVWVSSEHILEKCLVGVLDTPQSRKKPGQTLTVSGLSPSTTHTPVNSDAGLSLPVPTLKTSLTPQTHGITVTVPTLQTTPSAQNEEDALSLQMLRQAKIQSTESVEEDVSIQVPSWVREPEKTAPVIIRTNDEGSSVDPLPSGSETSVDPPPKNPKTTVWI